MMVRGTVLLGFAVDPQRCLADLGSEIWLRVELVVTFHYVTISLPLVTVRGSEMAHSLLRSLLSKDGVLIYR